MDQAGSWPESVPPKVNLDQPSAARMYDYYLGGAHNFAIDREAAERAIAALPATVAGARTNRAFLQRAVRFLVGSGIRQFIDLGSGIPTSGNVHEIAQLGDPEARVVYVDIDAVAVTHGQAVLAGNDRTAFVHADMRDVDAVLAAPELRRVIDFDQPIGLLMVAVLHFVPDSDGLAGVLGRYREALPAGSYLALSHMSMTGQPREFLERFEKVYANTANPVVLRSQEEISALFDRYELVEPGVVTLPLWRPDGISYFTDDPERFPGFAGVARKTT
ncbi:MAG TPA: SAM-dependent methyltransferase [Actinophytocola sp.]|uniref:SAM-dependent methyltransferase n=1 Tax=Actinophytocola sp. TaxID=1872138 RepID=UPI002DB66A5A|nr:SAM-dependent methyltransferase [Actinophytocola sp.]HEU5470587.1 SAM-dependent methyltransferase [Actinophytocola sp.]